MAGVGIKNGKPVEMVYRIDRVIEYIWNEPVRSYNIIEGTSFRPSTFLQIAIDNGLLCFVDGNLIRKVSAGDPSDQSMYQYYDIGQPITNSPCYMTNGIVLVPTADEIKGVRLHDNIVEHVFSISVAGASTPVVIGEGPFCRIVFTANHWLYAVKLEGPGWTTPRIYKQILLESVVSNEGVPVIYDNSIYMATQNYLHAFSLDEDADPVINRTPYWRIRFDGRNRKIAAAYGMIYATSTPLDDRCYMTALNCKNGAIVWTRGLAGFQQGGTWGHPVIPGAPSVGNGCVFVAAQQMYGFFDNAFTILFTFDAHTGRDRAGPVNTGLIHSGYTDCSVTLAFDKLYLNLGTALSGIFQPDVPQEIPRGTGNYCGFWDDTNTTTGAYMLQEEDFSVPTRGADLMFKRSYSSHLISEGYDFVAPQIPKDGPLGPGWYHNYGMRLDMPDPINFKTVLLVTEDGSACPYTFDPNPQEGAVGTPPAGVFDRLQKTGPNQFTLTRKDHSCYVFEVITWEDAEYEYLTGRLASISDDVTRTSTNSSILHYDAPGYPLRVTSVSEPANEAPRTLFINYYPNEDPQRKGKISEVIGPEGIHLTFDYTYSAPEIMSHSTVRDSDNQPDMPATRYGYAAAELSRNVLRQVQNPVSESQDEYTSIEYYDPETTADGTQLIRMKSKTDEMGGFTLFDYSTQNRTTLIQDPDGSVTVHKYDTMGRLTEEVDPTGHMAAYTYGEDGAGRTTRDKNGGLTTYEPRRIENRYTGDMASITDPEGNTTRYNYDELDRLVEIVDPRDTVENPCRTTFSYADSLHPYDLTRKVDANGNHTNHSYDAYGKTIATDEQVSADAFRRQEFGYDFHGNKIVQREMIAPDSWRITDSWVYDGASRMIEHTDVRGMVHGYQYTPGGKLRKRVLPIYDSDGSHPCETMEYNANGDLLRQTDAAGRVVEYAYDACGRPVEKRILRAGGREPLVERTEYNPSGNVRSQVSFNGAVTSYVYDSVERPLFITDPNGKRTAQKYDPNGNVIERTLLGYGTDNTERFAYDGNNRVVLHTNAVGEETIRTYDKAGNATSESKVLEDGSLSTTDLEYDNLNRVLRTLEPPDQNGQRPVTTNTYLATGEISATLDPCGHLTTHEYDLMGRVLAVTMNDGIAPEPLHTTAYIYSPNNGSDLPDTIREPNGNLRHMVYDELGRPLEVRDGSGALVSRTKYDAVGNTIELVEGSGPEVSRTVTDYDEINRPTRVKSFFGSGPSDYYTQTLEYYDLESRVVSTDANGVPTELRYDKAGRLTQKKEAALNADVDSPPIPLDRVTTQMYDDSSLTVVTEDPMGAVSYETVDNLGREIHALGPSGQEMQTGYNKLGKPEFVRTKHGVDAWATESYTYDLLGRPVSVTDPNGHTTRFSYDLEDNKISETDPEGNTTTFTYDGYNNPTSKTEPYNGGQRVTSWGYDASGNKTSETDAAGRTTVFDYDGRNRLSSVTVDPGPGRLNLTTSYTYDTADNLKTVTDPRNKVVLSRVYDNMGRTTRETDALGRACSYTYDGNGNLLTSRDPMNRTVSRSYNNADLVKTIALPNSVSDSVSYDYDKNLNPVEVTNNDGDYTLELSYDESNRLTRLDSSLTDTQSPDFSFSQSFTYDYRNKLKRFELEGGSVTDYLYDGAGNLVSADDTAMGRYEMSYYDDDSLKEVTAPGGLETAYAYWENGLVRSIATSRSPGEQIASFSYQYDGSGLPVARTAYIEGNPASGSYAYGYDTAGRLTSQTSSYENISYAYDRAGNMTGKLTGAHACDYQYNDACELVHDSDGNNYSYDACGNLTGISGGTRPATTYAYNELDQMKQATVGGSNASYTYDPLGRMSARSDADSRQTTTMFSTGDTPLKIENGDEGESYLYTPEGRLLGMTDASDRPLSIGLDLHGDVVFTADQTGEVTSSALYRPFGEKTAVTGSLCPALGFQSDYTDPLTGLIDMGVRDYDPALGRFNEEDPKKPEIDDPESFNPYVYADNAPLARVDIEGTSWLSNAWKWAKKKVRRIKRAVTNKVRFVKKTVKNVAKKISKSVKKVVKTAKKAVKAAGKVAKKGLSTAGRAAKKGLRAAGGMIKRGVAGVGGAAKAAGRLAMGGLEKLGAGAYYTYQGALGAVRETSRFVTGGAGWKDFLISYAQGINPTVLGKRILYFGLGLVKGAYSFGKEALGSARKYNLVRLVADPKSVARYAYQDLVDFGGAVWNSPKSVMNWLTLASENPDLAAYRMGEFTGFVESGLAVSALTEYALAKPTVSLVEAQEAAFTADVLNSAAVRTIHDSLVGNSVGKLVNLSPRHIHIESAYKIPSAVQQVIETTEAISKHGTHGTNNRTPLEEFWSL